MKSKFARVLLAVISLLLLCSYNTNRSIRELLNAIKIVETGYGSGINIKGDNGEAYGPYQIHKAYFIDSNVKGKWEQCLTDKEFSERVMIGYWTRYQNNALKSLDYEILSRCHNGGPKGHKKDSTIKYWQKVGKVLDSFK